MGFHFMVPASQRKAPKTVVLGLNLLMQVVEWEEAHMDTIALIVILSLCGVAIGMIAFVSVRGLRAYRKARGTRLVTCPETHCTTSVELDAKRAGLKALRGESYLRLQSCSRWPEKADCAQDCLPQIESLGQGCLVRSIVAEWYRGKPCVYCHKPVDKIEDWAAHMPALLTADNKTLSWTELPAETLPEAFEHGRAVCWSCHIAETFRREHPELVTDRPARW